MPRRMSAGAGSQAQARGFFLQHPLNVVQAPASVVLNAPESSGPGARVNTSGEGRNTKEERNQSMEYVRLLVVYLLRTDHPEVPSGHSEVTERQDA